MKLRYTGALSGHAGISAPGYGTIAQGDVVTFADEVADGLLYEPAGEDDEERKERDPRDWEPAGDDERVTAGPDREEPEPEPEPEEKPKAKPAKAPEKTADDAEKDEG